MGNYERPNHRSFYYIASFAITIILLLSLSELDECKKQKATNLLCDFETNFCDWTQLNSSTVDWIRKTAAFSPGGPKYDQ